MEKGSLGHIRRYVNDPFLRDVLNNLIFTASPTLAKQASGPVNWVSPLENENYKEFSDGSFLKACGLAKDADKLREFWPSGGPCWDALATVPIGSASQGVLLIEAKAHLGELNRNDSTDATDPLSLVLIERSLKKTRDFFNVSDESQPWQKFHYQVCNRFAHLYFMNEILKIPTWLVWLFIVDAPEWRDHANQNQWASRFANVCSAIGLPSSYPLQDRVLVAFAPAVRIALNVSAP